MARSRTSFPGLLLLLWSMAALVHWVRPEDRWLFSALALLTAGAAIFGIVLFSLRRLRGYWIEALSPGLLRHEDGDFAVIYHEGSRQLMLLGVQRPKPEADVLFVPAEETWSRRVEPWARSRRAQIVDRLLHDRAASHCEIRSSSFL